MSGSVIISWEATFSRAPQTIICHDLEQWEEQKWQLIARENRLPTSILQLDEKGLPQATGVFECDTVWQWIKGDDV